MRKSSPVILRCAAVLAAGMTLAACDITIGASQYTVREEKKFAVTGPARISLSTFDGSIEVRGWDRMEVAIAVEKRGPDQATVDKIHVQAAQDGNAITVDVPKPSPLASTGFRVSPGANLVVSVPVHTSVTGRSGDGAIAVRGVNGKIDLETDDGSVRVEDVQGDTVIRTGDGAVDARRIDGVARINTGDGSVRAEGVFKGLDLETRDGSVDVDARAGSSVTTDWTVTTGDGGIRLQLPEGLNAELDAQCSDGRVQVDRVAGGAPRTREDDERERRSYRGTLGLGGKALRVRSGSGSITVKLW